MLCGGVRGGGWSWSSCGYRTIVNDASTLGSLVLHYAKGALSYHEYGRQVEGNNGVPLLDREVFERHIGPEHPRVIENYIYSPIRCYRPRENLGDRRRGCYIGLNNQGLFRTALGQGL